MISIGQVKLSIYIYASVMHRAPYYLQRLKIFERCVRMKSEDVLIAIELNNCKLQACSLLEIKNTLFSEYFQLALFDNLAKMLL